ncbi:hypothetical protein LCGC14_0695530 [marine sediment metagenome]|uniref:Uncharacterized protein n=1 Tax=marine sediment metagenome TaxID=412755 RepID=A0A0F9QJB9_9ZZZZ|nr:MAG: hypothetical protein Lokiarch_41750 [Candidatus Lokiarchaeum sp. GC14_75]HEC37079.1 hypothetical protein [bacterium]
MVGFKVNDYISLKLEDNKTVIYVNNERFNQCKYLLLNISYPDLFFLEDIESVDEAALQLDKSSEYRQKVIPPETEFWGHCSNLQVWAENNYNTRLLFSNLAFPLLKELVKQGDPKAQKVLKDEIIKRFLSYELSVIQFLVEERYFRYFSNNEINILIDEMILISNEMSDKKSIGYFEALGMMCNDGSMLIKIIGNLSDKLKNQSSIRILDFLDNELKFYSPNSEFYKVLLKDLHISKQLFSLITSREYDLQHKVIKFLVKCGKIGIAYIIKWFPFAVRRFNTFNFKNALFRLNREENCLQLHLEMVEFIIYQIILTKEYNFENYNKLMEVLDGIKFLLETDLQQDFVEISTEKFYSVLKIYYDKCKADLIIDASDDIMQYKIQPRERNYYYDFLQERLPLDRFFRTRHDVYRELKKVLFPTSDLLIFGITGGWDEEFPFRVYTGLLGLSTREKEWLEQIKLNLTNLESKKLHKVLFKRLRKFLTSELSIEEKFIVLYWFLDYLIYEISPIEIRYIDVKVFEMRIKDYYEKKNYTVRFEHSKRLKIISNVNPKETKFYDIGDYGQSNESNQMHSLFKKIFFPVEDLEIIKIFKMVDYAFYIKRDII